MLLDKCLVNFHWTNITPFLPIIGIYIVDTYLKDIQYKYLFLIIELIYSGQCDVEELDIVRFLSVGKELGIIGLQEDLVINYDSYYLRTVVKHNTEFVFQI